MKNLFFLTLAVLLTFTGCENISDLTGALNYPPTAYIDSITPTKVTQGEVVTFEGHGTDRNGTVVAYRWRSSLDGDLSTKASFQTSSLFLGTHAIHFKVQDNNGAWSEEATWSGVTVTAESLPVINYFNADPANIVLGSSSLLSWNVSGATEVHIDKDIGSVSASGTRIVSPGTTTVYQLTASSAAGSNTALAVVTVSSQSSLEGVIVLSAIREESGALVKRDATYTFQETSCAGDTSLNLATRAFLSFDIRGIPVDAIINEAILDLSDYTQTGNPTYTSSMWGNMGALEVYFYQYGEVPDLDMTAYNKIAMLASGGNITSYPLSPWLVDVTDSKSGEPVVQNLIQSAQSRCQFRIQFFTSTNWDSKSDMFCFDGAKLIIKYTEP